MRYELLGPLRVIDGARHLPIGAHKMQTVLGALLVRAEHVVGSDELIAEIWGDRPPRRATATLHVYISQLRKLLHHAGRPAGPIVTRPPGYVLTKDGDELDVDVFLGLTRHGRALMRAGEHADAARRLDAALALWHGPLLGDPHAGPILGGFAARMMELRLECREMLTEAHLALGRHRELVGGLYSLIAEHPLREAFYRQLMIALYHSERQADALRVYQMARRTLRDELGLEPCRSLRDLHQAILTADDDLGPRHGVVGAAPV